MYNLDKTHDWSVVWWSVNSTQPEVDFESSTHFCKQQAIQFARNASSKSVIAVAMPTNQVCENNVRIISRMDKKYYNMEGINPPQNY